MFRKFYTKLAAVGLFNAYSYYLNRDFHYHPKNDDEPLTKKKVFFIFDTINQIKKLKPDELKKCELIVSNGIICQPDTKKPINSDKLIYILTTNNKMYATKGVRRSINHTSLGDNLTVRCAGKIKIEDGIVKALNEKSGHYRPKKRVHLMEENLKKAGAQFHPSYEGAQVFTKSNKR